MWTTHTTYSLRGKRAARTYVYGMGISLKDLHLESLESTQLFAQRYIPSEGRFTKVDLTESFLRFQRKVRRWVHWRRVVRRIAIPRTLLKRELAATDLASVLEQKLRSN